MTSTGLRKLQQKEQQTDHLKVLILAIPDVTSAIFRPLTEHQ